MFTSVQAAPRMECSFGLQVDSSEHWLTGLSVSFQKNVTLISLTILLYRRSPSHWCGLCSILKFILVIVALWLSIQTITRSHSFICYATWPTDSCIQFCFCSLFVLGSITLMVQTIALQMPRQEHLAPEFLSVLLFTSNVFALCSPILKSCFSRHQSCWVVGPMLWLHSVL